MRNPFVSYARSLAAVLTTSGLLSFASTLAAQQPWFTKDAPTGQVNLIVGDELWIGVECGQVDDALRVQLGLEAKHGLLVLDVAAESPAAKVGIHRHDILLEAGETKLAAVSDLMQAVQKAGANELTVKYLRGGKENTASVKPDKRPQMDFNSFAFVPERDRQALRQLEDWMKRNQAGVPRGPVAFHLYHPGVVLPSPALDARLPGDLTIVVTKRGDEPLRITVRKGDQSWETTRDKLDALPVEVRPYVAGFLGQRVEPSMPQGAASQGTAPQASAGQVRVQPQGQVDVSALLERQMREANARLEQQMRDLNDQMKKLQQQFQKPAAPPTERSKL